ncbi:MAG: hypothetical protein HY711_02025 [Candidatus Melainabacteria bacterium]|nr:hypothetical protein [Candidatus Melainabacteria bacterium]
MYLKQIIIALLLLTICLAVPTCQAQIGVDSQTVPGPWPRPASMYGGNTWPQASGIQPFGAPGSVGGPGWGTGTYYFPYQSSYGYPSPYASSYPVYGMPMALPNGYFSISGGGRQLNFWRAPSGFYYPWAYRPYLNYMPPVIVVQQGISTPTLPPLTTVFEDLRKFLDESKTKNKLIQTDYDHLNQRLKDLMGKEQSLKIATGGTLEQSTEADLRKDLDALGAEISYRVKP